MQLRCVLTHGFSRLGHGRTVLRVRNPIFQFDETFLNEPKSYFNAVKPISSHRNNKNRSSSMSVIEKLRFFYIDLTVAVF